jgi:hypothetical protein
VLSESKHLLCLTDKNIAHLFCRDKVLNISFLIVLMEGFLLDEWLGENILFLWRSPQEIHSVHYNASEVSTVTL